VPINSDGAKIVDLTIEIAQNTFGELNHQPLLAVATFGPCTAKDFGSAPTILLKSCGYQSPSLQFH
jgi:hypothetical protein